VSYDIKYSTETSSILIALNLGIGGGGLFLVLFKGTQKKSRGFPIKILFTETSICLKGVGPVRPCDTQYCAYYI
jgi:hypothetical protein